MQITYKDENGNIVNEKLAGFSVRFELNEDEYHPTPISMDGDITFICKDIKCKHREECKKYKIPQNKMAKVCPYMKKVKHLLSEYDDNLKDITPISLADYWYITFGDIKGLSRKLYKHKVIHVTHNCEKCKKNDTCKHFSKDNPVCELHENLFALSALGEGEIPVWNDDHTKCNMIMRGDCAKKYIEEQEKHR